MALEEIPLDWREDRYPFGEMEEGASCRVRLENGMEMEAACFQHHPCGDHPELWDDDWITNDPRCQDDDHGRLYGEQEVVAWRPSYKSHTDLTTP